MLIGFAGRAGSGKNTAADGLDGVWLMVSFASHLKEVLNTMFGWDVELWEDREWKEAPNADALGKSPRYVAQTLGTDWGRNTIDTNIWTSIGKRKIEALLSYEYDVAVTDVRFPNEADAIHELGGKVIYVVNADQPIEAGAHESEQDISHLCDFVVVAHFGDIDGLQEQTNQIIDKLRSKENDD